jgi:hypothetical protein
MFANNLFVLTVYIELGNLKIIPLLIFVSLVIQNTLKL